MKTNYFKITEFIIKNDLFKYVVKVRLNKYHWNSDIIFDSRFELSFTKKEWFNIDKKTKDKINNSTHLVINSNYYDYVINKGTE